MELIFISSGRQTIKYFFLSMVINKQGIPCCHNVYKGIKQNNIKWNNYTHDIILAKVVLGGLSEEVMVKLRPNR